MHLSSVLLPDPLRPTMPKNSPCGIVKPTPLSTFSSSYSVRRKGWRARSLSVWTWCLGMRKVFSSPSTSMAAGGRVRDGSAAPAPVAGAARSGMGRRVVVRDPLGRRLAAPARLDRNNGGRAVQLRSHAGRGPPEADLRKFVHFWVL